MFVLAIVYFQSGENSFHKKLLHAIWTSVGGWCVFFQFICLIDTRIPYHTGVLWLQLMQLRPSQRITGLFVVEGQHDLRNPMEPILRSRALRLTSRAENFPTFSWNRSSRRLSPKAVTNKAIPLMILAVKESGSPSQEATQRRNVRSSVLRPYRW